ncbi:MAG: glycosyltransferase [Solirubrobacteraceae bacterium]
MRVLQVTPYYAPAWAYGGPPRVMSDFATGLAARGHEVTVFTTDVLDAKQRAAPRQQLLDGVRVERFPNLSNTLAWHTKKYLPPGLVLDLARRLRSFDVVHATDARTLPTAVAALAARAAGVPFCLSAHGSLPGSAGVRGAVKRGYDALFVRPMLERAAALFAQTEHETRLYLEAGGRASAVQLLPLPLNLGAVPERFEPGFLHRRAGFAADLPLLLFLGRIHRLKGLDMLLEAAEPILHAGEAGLAIVGRDDGDWPALAGRFAPLLDSGAVRFVGPLYGAERFDAYADAEVFCLTPRHWEETSVAALEAAATGTPVVVTEQADIPGLADSGGGFVVPLDAAAILAATREALARGAEMGSRAKALVERQHDAASVVERLEGYLLAAMSA